MAEAAGREAVFPTRQSLGLMKAKLKGAETGHSLLKRKSEALTKRFREITKRIHDAKLKLGRVMSVAAFSLAEVTYAVGGDIGYQVQESAKSARFRLTTKQDNGKAASRSRNAERHMLELLRHWLNLPLYRICALHCATTSMANFALDINAELDELDREEFYRLKKVAKKKERDNAALDAELKKRRGADSNLVGADEDTPTNILAVEDDDVIF
ncbi:hypothetical protein SAPIO_CDS0859 [Scedosporium apiospermum]|uniref:V-type proton ATPase subunit D n=1 Tax=Pseudallescheria apiosperma TaxID=563466 RepID=A0A084GGQ2_PSEDA|nr:uncharacterized protein SAPIO_CDS0859 [Scedosporium apiospermum]KEZ46514.1 hypothetical protein SAPIO_CDS0859 [Scedosporium apiospermum]